MTSQSTFFFFCKNEIFADEILQQTRFFMELLIPENFTLFILPFKKINRIILKIFNDYFDCIKL